MQISFDPRDPNACESVLAVIAALCPQFARPIVSGEFDVGAALDDSLDPAEAFDAPNPAVAFAAPGPFASPVPTAVTAAEPVGSIPTPISAHVSGVPSTPDSSAGAATPPPPTGAQSAAPVPSVDVDADGVPWDSRIHSGPADKRPKNADGRWRRGRGVDDETYATVTAELRVANGQPAAPTPAAAPPAPPVPEAPVAAPPVPVAPVAEAPTPAPIAPPPTPAVAVAEHGPAVATTAVDAEPTNFAGVMKYVTGRQTAGTLTVADTMEVCTSLGLSGLRDLMQQPAMIPAFMALLPAEAA